MKLLNDALHYLKVNKRQVLTGASIVTSIWGAYEWCKAGTKISHILDRHDQDMKDCDPDDKEAKRAVTFEAVRDIAPIIVGPTIITATTCGMIFANDYISSKEIAILGAAYTVSSKNLAQTREKVKSFFGETEARKMEGDLSKDKLRKDEPIRNNNIVINGGEVLCKDFYSGRLFYSSVEKVEKAILELSRNIIDEMFVSLNDFYNLIDLDTIPLGDDLGWNIDNTIRGSVPIIYNAVLTDDNRPCLCLEFEVHPRMDYRNLH